MAAPERIHPYSLSEPMQIMNEMKNADKKEREVQKLKKKPVDMTGKKSGIWDILLPLQGETLATIPAGRCKIMTIKTGYSGAFTA